MAYEALFFPKCSKFYGHWENAIKNEENVFSFSDNCILSGSCKLSVELREYSQLAVNVLTSSPEISDLTKKDFFLLYMAQNDEEVG